MIISFKDGKPEENSENCCAQDSSGCTNKPVAESSKRPYELQNENQTTSSSNRSVEDYDYLKKNRQSETPSTRELVYGFHQEMQTVENRTAKAQPTNESFDKNRLFESLNYAAKVNVKPEFYNGKSTILTIRKQYNLIYQ